MAPLPQHSVLSLQVPGSGLVVWLKKGIMLTICKALSSHIISTVDQPGTVSYELEQFGIEWLTLSSIGTTLTIEASILMGKMPGRMP